MTKPLFQHLNEVQGAIDSTEHVLMGLDFDGTLAPFVEEPAAAKLNETTKNAMQRLASHPRFTLAIISGRPLKDLSERVGMAELFYAGNHGLEIRGQHREFLHPAALARADALGQLCEILTLRLRRFAGAWVENKTFTLSIHLAHVAPSDIERIRRVSVDALAEFHHQFFLQPNQRSFEIRPSVNWHKGHATSWLRDRLLGSRSVLIYFGDDQTDEDVFAEHREEVTVKVGNICQTSARYFVEGPDCVQRFLEWAVGYSKTAMPKTSTNIHL